MRFAEVSSPPTQEPQTTPLPPGWIERYDAQGNIWFDIQDEHPEHPESMSDDESSPSAATGTGATLSFAQRLYASSLPSSNSETSDASSHPQPHRAKTYQAPSLPPPVLDHQRQHHRAATYSGSRVNDGPTSAPTINLVARPPNSNTGQTSPNGQQANGTRLSPTAGMSPSPMRGGINASLPSPPPVRANRMPSPPPSHHTRRYSGAPVGGGRPLPPARPPQASRPQSMQYPSSPRPPPVQSPPPPPPPHQPQYNHPQSQYNQPQHQYNPRSAQSPPMQTSPPPPPQPQYNPRPAPVPLSTPYNNANGPQSTDRGLLSDVGKAVGSTALKTMGGVVLGALTGGVLSMDSIDGLTTMFSGMGFGGDTSGVLSNFGGFDMSQLQAVAQGQPGADYQSIIDSIMQTSQQQQQQQQQQASDGGVDYQSIIEELMKIQKQASAASQPTHNYQQPPHQEGSGFYQPSTPSYAPPPQQNYHHTLAPSTPSYQPTTPAANDFMSIYQSTYDNAMKNNMAIVEAAFKNAGNPAGAQQYQQTMQNIQQQQQASVQNIMQSVYGPGSAYANAMANLQNGQGAYPPSGQHTPYGAQAPQPGYGQHPGQHGAPYHPHHPHHAYTR